MHHLEISMDDKSNVWNNALDHLRTTKTIGGPRRSVGLGTFNHEEARVLDLIKPRITIRLNELHRKTRVDAQQQFEEHSSVLHGSFSIATCTLSRTAIQNSELQSIHRMDSKIDREHCETSNSVTRSKNVVELAATIRTSSH